MRTVAYRAKSNVIPDSATSVNFMLKIVWRLDNVWPNSKTYRPYFGLYESFFSLFFFDFLIFSYFFQSSDCANFPYVANLVNIFTYLFIYILFYAYICTECHEIMSHDGSNDDDYVTFFFLCLCLCFLFPSSALTSIWILYMFGSTIYHSPDLCIFVMFGFGRECVSVCFAVYVRSGIFRCQEWFCIHFHSLRFDFVKTTHSERVLGPIDNINAMHVHWDCVRCRWLEAKTESKQMNESMLHFVRLSMVSDFSEWLFVALCTQSRNISVEQWAPTCNERKHSSRIFHLRRQWMRYEMCTRA